MNTPVSLRTSVCLLALLLTSACATPPTPAPVVVDVARAVLLDLGDLHAAHGARTAAEAVYWHAAHTHSGDPTPYVRLAYLYLSWNRAEEGLNAVDIAAWMGSPATQVLPLRAALHARMEDWEQVRVYGTAALALTPTDSATRRRVAQANVRLGHVDAALADYTLLYAAFPTDPAVREPLGALLALSEPDAALPHLQAAGTPLAADLIAALEGDSRARFALLGQVYNRHAEWQLARLALEQAVGSDPDNVDAVARLGHTLDQLGQGQAALAYLEAAVEQAPDSALNHSLLGLHYLQAGNLSAARPHLEAAYDLDPENPALCLYLAYLYGDLGYADAADVWLEEAIYLAPADPVISEAVVHFYLNREVDAERALEAARLLVQQTPADAAAYDVLGWVEALLGHEAAAQDHWEHALELDPELAAAHYHLGWLYARQGAFDAAEAALVRAQDLTTDPLLHAQIAQALAELP
ncbi:MAG: tetratricopeptide repeat protein [Anaerolineae bacterium]|nr:tetratricopeptide repeat protein [Anaerolineae bacterium]